MGWRHGPEIVVVSVVTGAPRVGEDTQERLSGRTALGRMPPPKGQARGEMPRQEAAEQQPRKQEQSQESRWPAGQHPGR